MDSPADGYLTLTLPESCDVGEMPHRGVALGRFIVLGPLGIGGMGVVLSAYDPQLDRKVAVKLLRADLWGHDVSGSDSLILEAQAMARLSHPNVLAVHEVGFAESRAFVAMEQVEGRTLREWLVRTPRRSWSAILDMVSAAGDGLVAAHRAGIIHRDFKPENVLVGVDGRPRVSDFGLAGAAGRGAGTSGYMAPEQMRGAELDARADQFAFCVTLWEALQGERPVADPARPSRRRAPAWVFRVLQRGLASRPSDRWPAMEELLAALRRRGRRGAWLATALAVIVAGVGAFSVGRSATPPVCDSGRALVASVWNAEMRGRVAAAFARTGRPLAAETFARVDAALQRRLDEWSQAHRDVCEATRVRHEQSDTLLDQRMACLRHARSEMGSLVSLFADASGDVVDRAIQASQGVGDLASCAGPGPAVPPPRDADGARRVEALRDEVAMLIALRGVGRWKEGLARGREVVARARGLGYAPVLAAALVQTARFDIDVGDVDAGLAELYEAQRLASEAGDDVLVADAAAYLLFVLGTRKNQPDAADAAYHFAVAATARAGPSAPRLARLYGYQGRVLARKGSYAAALLMHELALVLDDVTFGPESFESVNRRKEVAGALAGLGQVAAARRTYEQAIATLERLVGADHPAIATLLNNHGYNLLSELDFAGAEAILERSALIFERTLGPDHRRVAEVLYNLAAAQEGQRHLPAARATIERAIRIQTAEGASEAPNLSMSYDVLAGVALLEGKADEAHRTAERALVMKRALFAPGHVGPAYTLRVDAESLLALGRVADARAAIDEAIPLFERTYGKEHAEVADSLRVLADVVRAAGRPRDAIPIYERSLAMAEKALGPGSQGLRPQLSGLAGALLDIGDAARALAVAERAIALPAAGPPGDVEGARLLAARARSALGRERTGARRWR